MFDLLATDLTLVRIDTLNSTYLLTFEGVEANLTYGPSWEGGTIGLLTCVRGTFAGRTVHVLAGVALDQARMNTNLSLRTWREVEGDMGHEGALTTSRITSVVETHP